jgi:hypothetical protein
MEYLGVHVCLSAIQLARYAVKLLIVLRYLCAPDILSIAAHATKHGLEHNSLCLL